MLPSPLLPKRAAREVDPHAVAFQTRHHGDDSSSACESQQLGFPKNGIECLYVSGKNNEKVKVRPNAFPWVNLNLDPEGELVLQGRHHSFFDSGFGYTVSLLEYLLNKYESQSSKVIECIGVEKYQGIECYHLVFNHPAYRMVTYVTQSDETPLGRDVDLRVQANLHAQRDDTLDVALDDALIAEVMEADVIVLGVPMYNLGVPVQLKCWIDAIARAGTTFRYTDKGPEGLIKGKKVYVALARGGRYRDTAFDAQVPYLKAVLGFLGMSDVQFIYAEGLNMGEEAARQGFAEAEAEIAKLVA